MSLVSKSQRKPGQQKGLTFVFGANFRSKNGCTICKTKKRKCDETLPSCKYCKARGLECVYKNSNNKDPENTLMESLDLLILSSTEYDNEMELGSPLSATSSLDVLDIFLKNMTPLMIQPSTLPNFDSKEIHYLEYFQALVSNTLCISFDEMNYFKKLYCHLAHNEEAFSYLVIAWGALYRKDMICDSEVSGYLNKGIHHFNKLFKDKVNGFDYYFHICFYLILTETKVCGGDVKEWRSYLIKTCSLIEEYGGLEKICEDFNFSNEIRFMISNIQYNEIMASTTLAEGTIIPIESYTKIFNHPSFQKHELNYGIDTLQGCHQSALLLLGDIMNHKVMLSKKLIEVESLQDKESGEYFKQKKEYYEFIELTSNLLWEKIENLEPNYQLLNTITDESDYNMYYKTYELFRVCCLLYWNLYIKQITPNNYQVKLLVLEAFDLIDYLMPTKMNVIACYPLLICAVCSYQKRERDFVESRISSARLLSPVNNIDKCWVVIQKVWELNPTGNVIVDWSAVCGELGWDLNAC